MKVALALLAAAPVALSQAPAPSNPAPASAQVAADDAGCRDRIQEVREERGLPRLDRGPARPDEAYLIAAVDHRIDGCGVMVMKNDVSDVRPIPVPLDGPPRLLPAR